MKQEIGIDEKGNIVDDRELKHTLTPYCVFFLWTTHFLTEPAIYFIVNMF